MRGCADVGLRYICLPCPGSGGHYSDTVAARALLEDRGSMKIASKSVWDEASNRNRPADTVMGASGSYSKGRRPWSGVREALGDLRVRAS